MEKNFNILVTGSKGQLGSELRFLAPQFPNCRFIFTDVEELDITKSGAAEKFVKENPVDFIINCAAYTAVDKAETEQDLAFLINTVAVDYLADAALSVNACLIHISTDYVFDGSQNIPYVEDDGAIPETVYGDTKYEGEKLLVYSNINYIILRTSWLYSSFGNNFVKTMLRLGNEKESINVVFDQIGSPTYARDLARAILSIIGKIEVDSDNPVQEVYHYTNEGVASWYDFACEIFRQKNISCIVNPVNTTEFPLPAKRPHYSILNKSKFKKDFGLRIPHWSDSLREMLAELK
jgi:dTDP-4-dehydrorhamnose reductase